MTTMTPKRQRVLRWLAYGVAAKLAIFAAVWLFAAAAQQIMMPAL